MNTNTLELRNLAAQVQHGNATAHHALQAELEESLAPLVRCALRRGTGLPAVVKWVQKSAAGLASSDALDLTRAVPRIARLLSAGLMEELRGHGCRPVHATVRGA